jgi:hypothetical protein
MSEQGKSRVVSPSGSKLTWDADALFDKGSERDETPSSPMLIRDQLFECEVNVGVALDAYGEASRSHSLQM